MLGYSAHHVATSRHLQQYDYKTEVLCNDCESGMRFIQQSRGGSILYHADYGASAPFPSGAEEKPNVDHRVPLLTQVSVSTAIHRQDFFCSEKYEAAGTTLVAGVRFGTCLKGRFLTLNDGCY